MGRYLLFGDAAQPSAVRNIGTWAAVSEWIDPYRPSRLFSSPHVAIPWQLHFCWAWWEFPNDVRVTMKLPDPKGRNSMLGFRKQHLGRKQLVTLAFLHLPTSSYIFLHHNMASLLRRVAFGIPWGLGHQRTLRSRSSSCTATRSLATCQNSIYLGMCFFKQIIKLVKFKHV